MSEWCDVLGCSLKSKTFLPYFVLFTVVPRTVAGPEQGLSEYLLNVLLHLISFWRNIG